MKNLIVISAYASLVLLMNGCGGGSSPATSNSTATVPNTTNPTPSTPNTAYMAFGSDTTKRLDVLYKTDSTAVNTSLVSNIMLPAVPSNYENEVLYGFETYGDYIYMHRKQKKANCSFPTLFCEENDIVKTKLADDTTTYMNMSTVSSDNFPTNNISMDITNHGMYIRHFSTGNAVDDYTISKVIPDGTVTTLLNTTGNEPNRYQPHIQVGDDIYYGSHDGTQYTLVKLDTSNDTFTHLNVFDNFFFIDMQTLNTKIYLSGGPVGGTTGGLYEYDPVGLALTYVANYSAAGASGPSSLHVFNSKIYYLASVSNGDNGLYVFNPIGNTTTRLETVTSNTFKQFFTFNNELYYTAQQILYKTDGTPMGAIAIPGVTLTDQIVYEANGKLYFAGDDGTNGSELWEYDGTTASMVLDINPGAGDSIPRHITELNGNIVFQASVNGITNKLYSYDGTTLTLLN